ncbi:hypothetical protein NEDG_01830 [Nematocida displodere]|uniref:Uncharacterized protein n=1 Tax=Nematocida displodere TaxID=1805483 RepID=A0A177EJN9_9MICR|nr:hypothetical protein NEDG_01830 [Nematocida displodere]
MLLIGLMLLGAARAIVKEAPVDDVINAVDIFGVGMLFLLFTLTLTVSFQGVKKLIEASPKQVAGIVAAVPRGPLKKENHDIITF